MKVLSRIYNALIFLFLYAPIVLLIVFPSTMAKAVWNGKASRCGGTRICSTTS